MRGGITNQVWCIGGGQLHDALCPNYEICKTLNCMEDTMKILIINNDVGRVNNENDSEKTDTAGVRKASRLS